MQKVFGREFNTPGEAIAEGMQLGCLDFYKYTNRLRVRQVQQVISETYDDRVDALQNLEHVDTCNYEIKYAPIMMIDVGLFNSICADVEKNSDKAGGRTIYN
jgi:hypothetical protein